jgi:hypothetical protein
LAYRIYVTDALQAISTNTAALIGEHGRHMKSRWCEIVGVVKPNKTAKSGDEIVDDVLSRIFGNNGGGE